MKTNKLLPFLLFILSFGQLNAQHSDFETVLMHGLSDYESGEYKNALSWFQQAYKLNRQSNKAAYYVALTHLALDNNVDAATHSSKVIKRKGDYCEDAYLVNATAWSNLGRKEKAFKILTEASKKFPDNYLIYYNLALTLYKDKNYAKAQEFAIHTIDMYPANAGSHLLLSHIMFAQGERIQSMLPLYYFLLLEPQGQRSANAYDLLINLWNQGMRQKGQRDIQLVKAGYKYGDFAQSELSLSLIETSQNIKTDNLSTTPTHNITLGQFGNRNNALFDILEEASKHKSGFWWDFYVSFFSKIKNNKLTAPFSYYISASRYNDDMLLWMSENESHFNEFATWMEAQ